MSVSIHDFDSLINRIFPDWLTNAMGDETVWVIVACALGGMGLIAGLCYQIFDIAKEKNKLAAWETITEQKDNSHGFDANKLWEVFCDYCEEDGGKPPTAGEDKAKSIATTLLQAEDGSLPLLDERLLTITSMVHESNNVSIMPSLSEMHDLSLQRVESKMATKLLSISASSVLVCGICGTLWGVHHKLTTTDVLNIEELGVCLVPSMFAVIFNIVLVWLRNINIAKLDRLVEKLDELTIAQFIPALQPDNNFGQILEDFVDATRKLEADNRLEYLSQTPETIAVQVAVTLGGLHELVSTMMKHASHMKDFFLKIGHIRDTLDMQKEEAETVRDFTKCSENRMHELKQTLGDTTQCIQAMGESLPATDLLANLREPHKLALESACKSQKDISAAIDQVQAWQGTCNSIVQKSEQHSANLYEEWKALDAVAASLQPLVTRLQELEQSFHRLYYATEGERTLFDYDAMCSKLSESETLLERGTEELKTKSDTAVEAFKKGTDGLVSTLGRTLESIGGVKRIVGEAERAFAKETQGLAPEKPHWWLRFFIIVLIVDLIAACLLYYYCY